MYIRGATASSLLDMYREGTFSKITGPNQPIITERMWKLHWDLLKTDINSLEGGIENQLYWKNITLKCLDLMDHVGDYMVGEFDCHNDDEIAEIWEPLIKNWYFGDVWITYDRQIMDEEIAIAEKEGIPERNLRRDNPFRIFSSKSETNLFNLGKAGRFFFKSLLTGVEMQLDPKEMINISWNDGKSWRRWWIANLEYIAGKSRVIDGLKALSKTVKVNINNKAAFEAERSQLENPGVFYVLKRQTGEVTESNIYQAMPIIDGGRVKDLLEIVDKNYRDECEKMGFTLNSNDKKERLTVAENYKDLRQITNLQDAQLKKLKIFERKLKEKGWVSNNFKIEISGLTYAQGLPDTVQAGKPQEEPQIIPEKVGEEKEKTDSWSPRL